MGKSKQVVTAAMDLSDGNMDGDVALEVVEIRAKFNHMQIFRRHLGD